MNKEIINREIIKYKGNYCQASLSQPNYIYHNIMLRSSVSNKSSFYFFVFYSFPYIEENVS